MVAPIFVILAMLGSCVVLPIAIPTISTYAAKKIPAYSKAVKHEGEIRKMSKTKEKNPRKERILAKKYLKAKNLSANRVLPSYDNLSKDNFFLKKLGKEEIKRQKLMTKIDLAKLNNNFAKVEQFEQKLITNFGEISQPVTKYNYIEKINFGGIDMEFSSNSIHSDVQSTVNKFKESLSAKANYVENSTFPQVAEIYSGDDKIASVSSTSNQRYSESLKSLMAEIYVKATENTSHTENEKSSPLSFEYKIETFDMDKKTNKVKKAHEHVLNTPESIIECATQHLQLNMTKEEFLTLAKDINKEMNPVKQKTKANTVKSVKTKSMSKDVVKSNNNEYIKVESNKTKKSFNSSLNSAVFAPTKDLIDFKTTLSFGQTEFYSMKTQSKTRQTTFSVDMLAEAYRKAIIQENAGNTFEIRFATEWKEANGEGTYDERSKEIVFSKATEIREYVANNFNTGTAQNISEIFDKKIESLNEELGMVGSATQNIQNDFANSLNLPSHETADKHIKTQKPVINCETPIKKLKERFNILSNAHSFPTGNVSNLIVKDDKRELLNITSNNATVQKEMLFDTLAYIYHSENLAQNPNKKISYTISNSNKTFQINSLVDINKYLVNDLNKSNTELKERAALVHNQNIIEL